MKYFQNPTTKEVFGYDDSDHTQLNLIQVAKNNNWTDVTANWPPNPSDDILKQQCKTQAMQLLSQTDWVEIPSVTNTNNIHYLTNLNEFLIYRNSIRTIAINPVTNPIWPTIPTEKWNN